MSCKHMAGGPCSQCAGAVARRVEVTDGGVLVDGLRVRGTLPARSKYGMRAMKASGMKRVK